MKDELVAVNRVLAYAMRLTPRERAILVEALLDEPAAMGRLESESESFVLEAAPSAFMSQKSFLRRGAEGMEAPNDDFATW